MAWRLWRNLTTAEFRLCDKAATIVVLPISATEQHGPHLPVGTDAHICNGLLDLTRRTSPRELNVLELPMLSVCASQEHLSFPGTLSIQSADFADQITALADRICAAGFGILVIVSSHGGNVAAMTDAALRCRQELKLLAVNLTWMRLGMPDGLISADERAFGVHGGLVETSLMLHFRPDLVAMERSENFYNLQENLANTGEILRAFGSVGFGWMAEDLNPAGVVGDAASAFADTGKQIADFQAARMITLLREITDAGTGLLTAPRR